MNKLPKELATQVKRAFRGNRMIADKVNRNSSSLPDIIRIMTERDAVPADQFAFDKAFKQSGGAADINAVRNDKAKAHVTGAPWGFTGRAYAFRMKLADACEAALNGRPLVAVTSPESQPLAKAA